MRTSFELKYSASDYEEARKAANLHISQFLGIPSGSVEDKVDVELKVELVEDNFQVTAFGKVKANSFTFGVDKTS